MLYIDNLPGRIGYGCASSNYFFGESDQDCFDESQEEITATAEGIKFAAVGLIAVSVVLFLLGICICKTCGKKASATGPFIATAAVAQGVPVVATGSAYPPVVGGYPSVATR